MVTQFSIIIHLLEESEVSILALEYESSTFIHLSVQPSVDTYVHLEVFLDGE